MHRRGLLLRIGVAAAFALAAWTTDTPAHAATNPSISARVLFSGSLDEHAYAVASDAQGNAYVTGYTTSPDFPLTAPMQSHRASDQDAFVAKIDPAGKIVYSTYLGGNGNDAGDGIAVDPQGDAWVTGFTRSTDFPVTADAFQPHSGGGVCDESGTAEECRDAFLTEVSPTGTLLYSTYLGGSGDDGGDGIALNPSGDIGITGLTESLNFPLKNAIRASLQSGVQGEACYQSTLLTVPCSDGFVSVFAPDGRSLLYSTFLGGQGADTGLGIAFNGGDAFVTGWTQSSDFPLAHPLQKHIGHCSQSKGGPACGDMFVTRLAADGQRLVYSTYLGGNGFDEGHGIAVDAHGNAYVAGFTTSSNFPIVHSVQRSHKRGRCLYSDVPTLCPNLAVVKLNSSGSHLIYSSVIGGNDWDEGNAIAVDAEGRAYVAGYAGSRNFPTNHPLQAHAGGGYDGVVLVITPAGTKAYLSTLYGHDGDDYFDGIAVGPGESMDVAGQFDTTSFQPSPPPYRGTDAIVLKIALGSPSAKQLP